MPTNTNFAEQINLAQHQAMRDDPSMISMGLGIDDPKGIFNTTTGLAEAFGEERVFDTPTSENAMTGVGIGAAIAGSRVLMTHQRVDFFLLAMDQLVNNAAKWHYMFNGTMSVPLTIRLIIGRGWGQGPTHQQSLQSWFTHIPGLKVVVPSLTDNVGQLLYNAIMDNNPTIFLEHRWLHNQQANEDICKPLKQKPSSIRKHISGDDITIISNSYMLLESLKAAEILKFMGVSCEVLEISEPSNTQLTDVYDSVNKTGSVLVTDISHSHYSVASELITSITENCFSQLKVAPIRLGLPNYPEPTSFGLTKGFYNEADDIVIAVANVFNKNHVKSSPLTKHDVPGDWFKGPF
ncbi:alpha-ketoacid dehydrogenase subunit beta [Algibacillus agarilyticus]|uniref:alpha-ketoacid dehydrogenase subunit beta n=1 Tax=Algibacillus agarilyticus TaxID=2234133 RepID=UPI000DD045E3|nr:transketolase C-terminal domain-containing protein [Algibacillus agarilyticus]